MSLLCEHCNTAKATVHITEMDPEKREHHLCESCAEKEGVIIKQHPATTNEILQQFIKHKTGLGAAGDLACPKCGMTFREFHLKGQLGCPNDYEAFRKLLVPLIERAHEGATRHVGKVPVTADETVHRQAGLLRLRRELQEAVEQEDYELAARVRDQIQTMESA
ncbi:MAG: UvrB/UvrC motif-containing protein [Phycisphaerae bacterium]